MMAVEVGNVIYENASSAVPQHHRHSGPPKYYQAYPDPRRLNYNPFISALKGSTSSLHKCLEQGVDINVCDQSGFSLLVYALHCRSPQRRLRTVRFLLSRDADGLARDHITDRDALLWAIHSNLEHEALSILQSGCVDLHSCDVYGYSALHYAVYHKLSRLLVASCSYAKKYHLSVDVPASSGTATDKWYPAKHSTPVTPYILARRLQHHECADLLVKYGGASDKQHDVNQNNSFSFMLFGFHDNDWSKREHRLPDDEPVSSASRGSGARSLDVLSRPSSLSMHTPMNYSVSNSARNSARSVLQKKRCQSADPKRSKTYATPFPTKMNTSPTHSSTSNPRIPRERLSNSIIRTSNDKPIVLETTTYDLTERTRHVHKRSGSASNAKMLNRLLGILGDESQPAYAKSAPSPDADTLNRTSYPWPSQRPKVIPAARSGKEKFARAAKRISNVAFMFRNIGGLSGRANLGSTNASETESVKGGFPTLRKNSPFTAKTVTPSHAS